jgi:hypothetical protein
MKILTHDQLWALPDGVLYMAIDNKTGRQGPLKIKETSYAFQNESTFEWHPDLPGDFGAEQMVHNYLPLPYGEDEEAITQCIKLLHESNENFDVEQTWELVERQTDEPAYFLVLDEKDVIKHIERLQEAVLKYPTLKT